MDAPLTPAFALILLDRQKTDNASLSFGVKPNSLRRDESFLTRLPES